MVCKSDCRLTGVIDIGCSAKGNGVVSTIRKISWNSPGVLASGSPAMKNSLVGGCWLDPKKTFLGPISEILT